MAVKKKITPLMNTFIDKGADVKSNKKSKSFKNILIRVPDDILNQIDKTLEKTIWTSRTHWIIEALLEKLAEESYE